MVQLTAAERPGSSFTGWGGACAAFTSSAAATITLRSDITCSATFDVTGGDPLPTAAFTVTTHSPTVGVPVWFDSAASTDDTRIVQYAWDFDDNGVFDLSGGSPARVVTHVYDAAGSYRVRLRVTDGAGGTAEATQTVVAAPAGSGGNPVLTLAVAGVANHGVVTLTLARVACLAGQTCTYADYPAGSRVMLEASPYSGSTFGGWTGCDSVEGTVCWVDMTGLRSVTARIDG